MKPKPIDGNIKDPKCREINTQIIEMRPNPIVEHPKAEKSKIQIIKMELTTSNPLSDVKTKPK